MSGFHYVPVTWFGSKREGTRLHLETGAIQRSSSDPQVNDSLRETLEFPSSTYTQSWTKYILAANWERCNKNLFHCLLAEI